MKSLQLCAFCHNEFLSRRSIHKLCSSNCRRLFVQTPEFNLRRRYKPRVDGLPPRGPISEAQAEIDYQKLMVLLEGR
jgi:hypothetical protein